MVSFDPSQSALAQLCVNLYSDSKSPSQKVTAAWFIIENMPQFSFPENLIPLHLNEIKKLNFDNFLLHESAHTVVQATLLALNLLKIIHKRELEDISEITTLLDRLTQKSDSSYNDYHIDNLSSQKLKRHEAQIGSKIKELFISINLSKELQAHLFIVLMRFSPQNIGDILNIGFRKQDLDLVILCRDWLEQRNLPISELTHYGIVKVQLLHNHIYCSQDYLREVSPLFREVLNKNQVEEFIVIHHEKFLNLDLHLFSSWLKDPSFGSKICLTTEEYCQYWQFSKILGCSLPCLDVEDDYFEKVKIENHSIAALLTIAYEENLTNLKDRCLIWIKNNSVDFQLPADIVTICFDNLFFYYPIEFIKEHSSFFKNFLEDENANELSFLKINLDLKKEEINLDCEFLKLWLNDPILFESTQEINKENLAAVILLWDFLELGPKLCERIDRAIIALSAGEYSDLITTYSCVEQYVSYDITKFTLDILHRKIEDMPLYQIPKGRPLLNKAAYNHYLISEQSGHDLLELLSKANAWNHDNQICPSWTYYLYLLSACSQKLDDEDESLEQCLSCFSEEFFERVDAEMSEMTIRNNKSSAAERQEQVSILHSFLKEINKAIGWLEDYDTSFENCSLNLRLKQDLDQLRSNKRRIEHLLKKATSKNEQTSLGATQYNGLSKKIRRNFPILSLPLQKLTLSHPRYVESIIDKISNFLRGPLCCAFLPYSCVVVGIPLFVLSIKSYETLELGIDSRKLIHAILNNSSFSQWSVNHRVGSIGGAFNYSAHSSLIQLSKVVSAHLPNLKEKPANTLSLPLLDSINLLTNCNMHLMDGVNIAAKLLQSSEYPDIILAKNIFTSVVVADDFSGELADEIFKTMHLIAKDYHPESDHQPTGAGQDRSEAVLTITRLIAFKNKKFLSQALTIASFYQNSISKKTRDQAARIMNAADFMDMKKEWVDIQWLSDRLPRFQYMIKKREKLDTLIPFLCVNALHEDWEVAVQSMRLLQTSVREGLDPTDQIMSLPMQAFQHPHGHVRAAALLLFEESFWRSPRKMEMNNILTLASKDKDSGVLRIYARLKTQVAPLMD